MNTFRGLDLNGSGLLVHAIYSSGKAKCECVFGEHSSHNDNAIINLIPEIAAQYGGVVFHCYSCKKTIRSYKSLRKELLKYDIEIDITNFTDITPNTSVDHEQRIYEAMQLPLAYDNDYLFSRKVTNEQIEKFEIRGDSQKIVFPRYNIENLFCGITIRFQQKNNGLRYLDLGDKNIPFGLNHIDYNVGDIAIVEGAFGVLRLDSFRQQAIGILGSSKYTFSDLSWFEKVYIGVDDDEAGTHHLYKIKTKLPQAFVMTPDEYDELDKNKFLKYKEEASIIKFK